MKYEQYKMLDEVNSPSHYTTTPVETIDVIKYSLTEEEFHGYLKGNIMKYVSRHKHKHPKEPQKDLLKAQWYLERLIETFRKGDPNDEG